jgi:hypothetical protein
LGCEGTPVTVVTRPPRDGPGRPFAEYYTQTPTHLWIYDLDRETLEEIAMEANHQFKEHGGKEFVVSPCLNDDDNWCDTVGNWINKWAK